MAADTEAGERRLDPLADPPYDVIRDALHAGRVIPFLGAGASLTGRGEKEEWTSPQAGFLPKSNELADYLRKHINRPAGSADLTQVAQYVAGVNGRGVLDDALREVFSTEYTPGPVHHFLAEFTNLLIVTTNYDTLLEQAFASKPHHVLIYDTGQTNLQLWEYGATTPRELTEREQEDEHEFPGLGTIPIIFKMHGAPDRRDVEHDSYVITDDDYLEFLARMQTHQAVPLAFAKRFRQSHFLFLGYGLHDWNLRVILHQIWRNRRSAKERKSWAIQYPVDPLEWEFWYGRGLRLFEMTVDQLVQNLREAESRGRRQD